MKISRNELKKLIEQELKEYSVGAGAGSPSSFAQGKNPDDLGHLGSNKGRIISKISKYYEDKTDPSNVEVLGDLIKVVDTLSKDELTLFGAADVDAREIVNFLTTRINPDNGEIDPFADTKELPPLDVTQPLPSIRREGKKINKSDLQQIIVQELKSILKED